MPKLKRLTWLLGLLAPLACLAQVGTAPAAADSTAKKTYLLAPVRVIAESPSESIGSIHLVDFAQASQTPALNLYDGLQGIVGLTNTAGTRDESNLRLRGFRKNEVKLMIDGRPLNGGYFGNVDLHQVAPAAIREIRIVKGPGSALYGTGTMGGVVNIITADPDNREWLSLDLLAKRNNSNRLALSSARRLGDFGYWLYAAREHNEGLVLPADFVATPFENGGVRNHSGKTQYDLQTRLDYELNPLHQIGLSAGLSAVPEKLIPSSVNAMDYRSYKDMSKTWATLEYSGAANEALNLSGHLYYDGGADTYQQFNNPSHTVMTLDSRMRYFTLGASPRLQWKAGADTWDLGLRLENLHSTRKDNAGYSVWTPHWQNLYNAFGQLQHRFSDALSASAGIGLSGAHSDLKDRVDLDYEPSLGIYFKFSERSESSLSIGKNSAYPTLRQLFSADHGNPGLEPQYAVKTELDHRQGFNLGGAQLSNRFTLYFNDARGLIDQVGESYQNIDRMQSWGAEYSLMLAPLPGWETSLDYACLFWASPTSYRLTESPRNQFSFSQTVKLPWKTVLDYGCQYTDNRQSQDELDRYHTLPAYWSHDLKLVKEFGRQAVALGLENILDTLYETEYGYPAAGRNFFLRLSAML